ISVFNIFAMLSMTVVKKQRDMGVLAAMGASPRDIRDIFLWEGVMVGVTGTTAGTVLGVLLCVIQQKFEVIRFDPQSFIMSAIPVAIAWPEVLAVVGLTVVSSFVATIVPARRAAAAHVARSLRTE
ncbi:MAG: ABC transporter permease, partial [Candidatus Kapaibacterium sp.]